MLKANAKIIVRVLHFLLERQQGCKRASDRENFAHRTLSSQEKAKHELAMSPQRLWLLILSLLLTNSQQTRAALTFVSPPQYAGLSSGLTPLESSFFGDQDFWAVPGVDIDGDGMHINNVPVYFFGDSYRAQYCGTLVDEDGKMLNGEALQAAYNQSEFLGGVVVVNVGDEMCLRAQQTSSSYSNGLDDWCLMFPLASAFVFIRSEGVKEGLFMYELDYRTSLEDLEGCIFLEISYDSALPLTEALEAADSADLQIMGDINIDTSDCRALFDEFFLQLFLGYGLSFSFLFVACSAGCKIKQSCRNTRALAVFVGNSITCLILALALFAGRWMTQPGIAQSVNIIVATAFLGTTAGTDALLAAHWSDFKLFLKQGYGDTDGKKLPSSRTSRLLTYFGIVIICLDWIVSGLLTQLTVKVQQQFLMGISIVFMSLQFLANGYLMQQLISGMKSLHQTIAVYPDLGTLRRMKLLRKVAVLVTISIISSFASIACLCLVGLTNLYLGTCSGYIVLSSILLLSKLLNAHTQNSIILLSSTKQEQYSMTQRSLISSSNVSPSPSEVSAAG